MPRTPLLIFPYNGNALEAIDCLGPAYELVGFVDDTPAKQAVPAVTGHPVFSRDALTKYAEAKVLAVPGSPVSFRQRPSIIDNLNLAPSRFATVVHPKASVSPLASLGHNVLIMAGCVVTSNATIGNHVCILPNSVIHHDVVIGDFTLIGSSVVIAGGTRVGVSNYIGSGSRIINGIELGNANMIGLGSNVIRSVSSNHTLVGNPARILRTEQN